MSITVEVGKYYRTARGRVHGPMEANKDPLSHYPLRCPQTYDTFMVDGRFAKNRSGFDLISECTAQGTPSTGAPSSPVTTTPTPHPHAAVPSLVIEAGKYYVSHRGQGVGPMRKTGSGHWQCSSCGKTFTSCGAVWLDNRPDAGNLYMRIPGPLKAAAFGGGSGSIAGASGGSGGAATTGSVTVVSAAPASPADLGDIVDAALASQRRKEETELERMQRLPSAEERLAEYRRNVARLVERGNLY